MAISRVFDIARRSLAVYQKNLDVSAHNIANSANANYSRQRAVLTSDIPEQVGGFVWGSGVKIADVQRAHDTLLDKQIINYNQRQSSDEKQSSILEQVEKVFAEPGDQGLSNVLDQFFNSWQELSVSPNSIPLRNSVINIAKNISSRIKGIHDDLDIVKSDTVNDFRTQVNSINMLLKDIQSFNSRIFEANAKGLEANDLMDQRDKSIEDLSKLVNISVSYDNNNIANVSVGGVFAADASFSTEFSFSVSNNSLSLVTAVDQKSAKLTGGALNALATVYNTSIADYQSNIDTIANSLVQKVNDIHKTGYSITDPPKTGINFFDEYTNGLLVINDDILRDPKMVAVSSDGTDGNSDIAVKIGELSDAKSIDGLTFSEKYASLISKVGTDKQTVDQSMDSNQLVLDQLQNQKSSYSGVSVDEEMTNILTYQRAYQASAKMVQIADQLIETLINMV